MNKLFDKFQEYLSGKKTYLAAISAVITALMAYATGNLEFFGLIGAISAAFGASSLRAAIAKIK